MGKKKKLNNHITIEEQLENYYLGERHTERHEVLWHAWCQNKRWLSQLLETTLSSFPTYSKHDESHARTVLHNIELVLGQDRIRELSASDCFMLLHVTYIHDIGMVITYEDREKIVQNDRFIEMIMQMEDENDPVFQKAISALQKKDYSYTDDKEQAMKKLYSDKLAVYYAILHLLAHYQRSEHGDVSRSRLEKWALDSEKLGAGFSMAGIPQRIFLLIAKCAGLHTDSKFEHIMELPIEDTGYVGDYLHPRFVAVLLQLGDILDMDNDRFHPLTREIIGAMPELSERHFEKHKSIRRLYIRPDRISIEADCGTQEALRLIRKECDMLRDLLKEAGYNWMMICPRDFSGALPTVESVKLFLKGSEIPKELVATQFRISQQKAFSILEGSNVYDGQFVFLREFLQNAIDASKIQYWNECVRKNNYYRDKETMKNMSPNDLEKILSTDNFPIEIEMEIVKRNEKKANFPVTEEDIEELRLKKNTAWQYGVNVRIKDFGTGIDKESILNIADVGASRKRERFIIKEMPEWLMPTAEFGLGLQSAFILTNSFKCNTYTRSNEKYEVTFSTVKSNFYEGYINVCPLERFENRDDTYGTCFEVFIPAQKKLRHEMCPPAWDGKDYFDEDYEALRPLRHSAELLAQMALYLDKQIGEQLFPIHLNVVQNPNIEIPLNISEKNTLQNLKHNMEMNTPFNQEVYGSLDSVLNPEKLQALKDIFRSRIWNENGKSWLYYHDSEKIKESREIVIEEDNKSIALLDGRNGHLYFWENKLCTFCVMNMGNFLQQERSHTEKPDRQCETLVRGVPIYYKGIILEEMQLPDIGNELFQYIDIKGKLDREYINLSRKGFTESGENYFAEEIYKPLLESLSAILKVMDKKRGNKIVECIDLSLRKKQGLLNTINGIVNPYAADMLEKSLGTKQRKSSVYDEGLLQRLEETKKQIVTIYKEDIISITMLAFFAQKTEFNPAELIGGGEFFRNQGSCWGKVIENIRKYCRADINNKVGENISSEKKDKKQSDFFGNSVLFHIYHRPHVNLLYPEENKGGNSGTITFPDIFSNENQFMIVSKRENASAPWKQYLVPIWSSDRNKRNSFIKESIIDLLKEYTIMDEVYGNKGMVLERIMKAGDYALQVALTYGIDAYGNSGAMTPEEYMQQYLIKWLLKNIPTIALFMNEDGNIRVNIIHGQILPFIFVNNEVKNLIIQRIFEETKRYGIQRFSVPAWQGTEDLSCQELPYTLYFLKRGYLSDNSYSKVIFPFDHSELMMIDKFIHSVSEETISKITELFESLNINLQLEKMMDSYHFSDILDRLEIIEDRKTQIVSYLNNIFYGDSRRSSAKNIERVLGRVRTNYRDYLIGYINSKENILLASGEFSVDDKNLPFYIEQWKRFYAYIFLETLRQDYLLDISLKELNDGDFHAEVESLAKAWIYIIKKEYLQYVSEVRKYKQIYMDDLENTGKNYDKQERILDYILKNSQKVMRREFLQYIWKKYVEELFGIFEHMEDIQLLNLERLLPDKNAIENGIKNERR